MKTYVMRRSGHVVRATVHQDRHEAGEVVRPLVHLAFHSPDGFGWGYHGSGPADLARSIVGDLLQTAVPDPVEYLAVKSVLVAGLPYDGGEITEKEVLEVLGR